MDKELVKCRGRKLLRLVVCSMPVGFLSEFEGGSDRQERNFCKECETFGFDFCRVYSTSKNSGSTVASYFSVFRPVGRFWPARSHKLPTSKYVKEEGKSWADSGES